MGQRSFRDKTVLITGAAGGLGAALCRRFGQAGARIGALDLQAEALDALAEDLRQRGIHCATAACDISAATEVSTAIGQVEEPLGPTDVLINNAGITHRHPFGPGEADAVARVLAVNFTGSVHCTAAVFDQVVARRGLFVAISSVAGFAPLIDRSAYAASKHALHGFFNTLRTELRGTGVDVLLVCPSFIRTGLRDVIPQENDGDSWPVAGSVDSPEWAAEHIFHACVRGRRQISVGRVGHLSYWVYRFAPRFYEWLMIRRMR